MRRHLIVIAAAFAIGCTSTGAGTSATGEDSGSSTHGETSSDAPSNVDDTGTAPSTEDSGTAPSTDAPTTEDSGSSATDAPAANDAPAADDSGTPPANDAGPNDTGTVTPPDSGAPAGTAKVVAYYATWTRSTMPPSSIPWSQVTHIAHAFFLPSASGGLSQVASTVDAELIADAHKNGVKVVASVGGAGASFAFASNASERAATVAAMASLCRTYGYDGIDIDWEFPDATTTVYWSALIDELRVALDAVKPGLTISAAVGSSGYYLDYLSTASLEKLDWIGLMTYDYAGDWSATSGYDAPLFAAKGGDGGSVSDSITYMLKTRGIPPAKVFMGLPFYGHSFGCSSLDATPVSPSDAPDYRDITPLMGTAGWTKAWDATAQVPYLTRAASPGFMSYDDATSIAAKCTYAKKQSLGGTIVWHLAGDRMPDGSNPLLVAAQGCR